MKNSLLNQLLRLSSSVSGKLSSLMASFVTLVTLMGIPDAYCMMECDEEPGSLAPRQALAPQDGLFLEEILPAETWAYIFSFLEPKDLAPCRLVSQNWKESTEEAIRQATRGKTLDLSGGKITNEQLLFLTQFPFAGLILTECGLDIIETIRVIAPLKQLKLLDLSFNSISYQDQKALSVLNLLNLTSLDLWGNYIGNEGAKALATANLGALTSLKLTCCHILSEGARALALGNLVNITFLNLSYNCIGDVGLKALANGTLINITSLNLCSNNIKDEGAVALARGKLRSITSLNLMSNNIGNWGAEALASGNLVNLTSLQLAYNKIENAGAKALAEGNLINLTSLHLQNNKIGIEGVEALRNANFHKLIYLNLKFNRLYRYEPGYFKSVLKCLEVIKF